MIIYSQIAEREQCRHEVSMVKDERRERRDENLLWRMKIGGRMRIRRKYLRGRLIFES